jgi:SAM-dependent methyltransferase
MEKYLEVNKSLWDKRTEIHVKSEFYDVESFKKGKSSLNYIEIEGLGDVSGKSLLHLQCHFGMDTLSWSRLGAKAVGVDLSETAIKAARELNSELGLDAEFVCSDIYSLKDHLDKKFDIAFTSYGTIGWLPDLDKWADIISHFLKPGGIFYIADIHPLRWIMNDDLTKVEYSYFNTGPIIEETTGSYADRGKGGKHLTYGWNHPFSEIFTALLRQKLNIVEFNEYPFIFYNTIPNSVKNKDGYWEVKGLEDKLPLMYSLKAVKG